MGVVREEAGSVEQAGNLAETGAQGPERSAASGSGSGAVGEALATLLRVLARRGREEAERLAVRGRVRLDLRQLRRDRAVMYQKLGREVRSLVEGGEIDHPGLVRGVERIRELDRRIEEVEASVAPAGEDAAGEEPTSDG